MRAAVLVLAAALAGCSDDETTTPPACAPGSGAKSWQVALDGEDLDRVLLSAWGTGPCDVYAVGGPLGNEGFETLVVHYDGTAWRELPAGGTETFWWVGGTSSTDVWMVGTEGRIAHWDGAAFTEHESGTTATLWGVWAAAPDDAWAVGGMPDAMAGEPTDVVLRWDGSTWSAVQLPMALGRALFKVWGTSSDDLYAVGEASTIWHKKGSEWTFEGGDPPLAQDRLFTVAGCSATEIYAVGRRDVLRSNGTTWEKLEVDLTSDVNGVSCNAPGEVAIVGFGGLKQRLVGGTWINEFDLPPYKDLHGVWADGAGNYWAVGGDFLNSPAPEPREGVVGRYGAGAVPTSITR